MARRYIILWYSKVFLSDFSKTGSYSSSSQDISGLVILGEATEILAYQRFLKM